MTAAAARSAGTTTTWPPAAWTCTSPRAARTACTSAAWARPASCGPSSWTPARSSPRRRARPAGPGPARLQPAPLACVSAVCERLVSCAPGLRRAWLRPGAQRAAGGARLRGACRCTARLPCSQRARAGRSQRGRARGAGALRGATPVPAQGLDHGAVGRRVLHHRHRRCAAPPAPAPRPQAALLGASPAGPARVPWRCEAPAWGWEPARHHMRRSALRPRLREAVRARRAGSNEASSLVVMSKGARFSQQSYKVSEALPYEWIRKKWREARPPPPPARGLRALTGAVPAHECGRPAAPAAPLTACRVSTAAVLLRAARCSHGLPPACALACGARRRMGEKRRRRQGEPPCAPARRAFTSRAWRPRAPAAAAAGAGSGRSS